MTPPEIETLRAIARENPGLLSVEILDPRLGLVRLGYPDDAAMRYVMARLARYRAAAAKLNAAL